MSNLISNQILEQVKIFEGFRPTPYYDCVGVLTLGYGMTGDLIKGMSFITEEKASEMLEIILNDWAEPIKSDLDNKGVTLTQNQFDALVSMSYNIGTAGLLGSTLYRNILSGIRDVSTITGNFQAWCHDEKGNVVPGLYTRRTKEAEIFFGTGNTLPNTTETIIIKEVKKVQDIVVVGNDIDQRAGGYLADYLECPIIRGDLPFDYSTVTNVYCVGSEPTTNGVTGWTSYAKKIFTGTGRYNTCRIVLDYIESGQRL